jgi:hypothetical protein
MPRKSTAARQTKPESAPAVPELPEAPRYILHKEAAGIWLEQMELKLEEYTELKHHLGSRWGHFQDLPEAPPQTQPPPAVPTALDLLRAKAYDLPDEVLEARRVALFAMILKATAEMSAFKLQTVAQFIDVADNDGGSDTPAENLLTSLVRDLGLLHVQDHLRGPGAEVDRYDSSLFRHLRLLFSSKDGTAAPKMSPRR